MLSQSSAPATIRTFRGPHGNTARVIGAGIPLETLEIGLNLSSSLVANLAILFQCLADDVSKFLGEGRVQMQWRYGLFVQDGIEDRRGCRACKRHHPGGHLVEN